MENMKVHFAELTWKDSFNSGHPELDGQHRGLFAVANELAEAARGGRPKAEIIAILHRLMDDVVRHFRYEEQFLEQVGFVELDEHAAEHARLLARGRAMLEAFASGQLHVGELFRFFSHDIVTRHLLGDDRRYFPRVTDQP
jgi:hemerythrin-like metal-binding protein